MSKYSSFKSHQLITENWRNYLNEEDEKPQPEEVVASAKKILASPKGHKAIAKLLKDPEFRKQMDQSLGQEISEGDTGVTQGGTVAELAKEISTSDLAAQTLGGMALGNAAATILGLTGLVTAPVAGASALVGAGAAGLALAALAIYRQWKSHDQSYDREFIETIDRSTVVLNTASPDEWEAFEREGAAQLAARRKRKKRKVPGVDFFDPANPAGIPKESS